MKAFLSSLRELKTPVLFLLPLLSVLVLFILVPVTATIIAGFTRDITFLPKEYIGLENYLKLFSDAGFWQSFRFTFLFILISVPLEIVLGLLIASLLHTPSRFQLLLRATALVPWAVPAAVSARIWELIFNFNYGLLNSVLEITAISHAGVNWLGTSGCALGALVAADVWKTTPFVAIILLAGLSAVPQNIYRQAQIDGANFVQRFFRVTIPVLRPILVVCFLFRTIDALRVFDLIFILTGGGPGGATTSLSLLGYKYFVGGDYGYGSAISVVLFLCALGLSVLYVRSGKYSEEIA